MTNDDCKNKRGTVVWRDTTVENQQRGEKVRERHPHQYLPSKITLAEE